MKSLEQFDKKVAEARAELAREIALRDSLPQQFAPKHISSIGTRRPWVLYECETISTALDVIATYGDLVDVSAIENGCLSIDPVGEHSKTYQGRPARWEVSQCIEMRQHGGRGFYSATISAWPSAPSVKINCDIKAFPWKFRASISANYDRHGEVISVDFREPDILRSQWCERVKFGRGSRDAFDIRYYFSSVDHLRDVLQLAD